jgi:phosphohistidine phosphatase SixA
MSRVARVLGVAAALLFWTAAAAAPGTPDASAALEGRALVEALRAGGHVIYFRHADTGPAYLEQGVDLERCETQRNLNEDGRRDAEQIGAAFRGLGIPVGEVKSSQFCRCKDTAQLAFGRYTVERRLTGVSRAPEAEQGRLQASRELKRLLAAMPSAGSNTVLVSHGFNLWDAEGFHLGTQGEAAVYRPDGRGGYRLIARLMPRDWTALRDSVVR